MDDLLKRLADLRQVLLAMEHDLGLAKLTDAETKVLYSARLLMDEKSCIYLTEWRDHSMLNGMSRSSFFRALKTLIELGFIEKTGPEKRAGYVVNKIQ